MYEFFIGTYNRMEIGGALHIGLSVTTVVIAFLIYCFRYQLKEWKHRENVRYVMAGILFANMTIHYASKIVLGTYDWKIDLPLHLCFLTGYAMMFILVSGNFKNMYSFIYFFTFVGPLPAMIWPDLSYSYDSFVFYQFVISHHFMILCSIYCLFVLEYKVRARSIVWAIVGGNILVGAMYVFNKTFGTNYIMMESLPDQLYEIYPFLYALPPVFWLELVGVLAIAAAYIPAYIQNRSQRETAQSVCVH